MRSNIKYLIGNALDYEIHLHFSSSILSSPIAPPVAQCPTIYCPQKHGSLLLLAHVRESLQLEWFPNSEIFRKELLFSQKQQSKAIKLAIK